jgi:cysteine desulfurase family protein (TIGR01976 family)
VAFFDGPGGTQVPDLVIEAVSQYFTQHCANTHWAYPTSVETDWIISNARETLGDFLGASPDEISFGANMTTIAFHLGRALGRGWGPGDEVVVTELDHHANVDSWRALERDRSVTIRTVRMDPATGEHDWDDLTKAINSRTKLVAIGAASNALGTITDVRKVADMAHEAGALVFVDAVHYAPHRRVDVEALGADFLACSAYKFCGPHVGVLFARTATINRLDLPKLIPAPGAAPESLETGTQNHEGIAGAAAAVEFYASMGEGNSRKAQLDSAFARLEEHEAALIAQLWNGLGAIPGITRFGPPPSRPRTATVSFTVPGIDSRTVSERLAAKALFASHGDFYATTVIERLGLSEEGVVRVGCAPYTSPAEVNRLLEALAELARAD